MPLTRRLFLKHSLATAAPLIIPVTALGRGGRPAPSDRLALGVIGCGSQGNSDLNMFLWKNGVEVTDFCDPDRKRRLETRDRVAKHLAENGRGSGGGLRDHNDFRELLARDDVDLILMATPDHWHAPIITAACRAGKDIYGEKPLALTVRQGRAIADAVKRHARVFQTGSWQRSVGQFRHAVQLVRNGRLGKILGVTCGLPSSGSVPPQPEMPVPDGFDYELWLGPAPWAPYTEKRCHWNFRWISDYSGGILTDWGAHHPDIVQWALDKDRSGPVEVSGRGVYPDDGLWNTAMTYRVEYAYADGVKLLVTEAAPNGVRFEGEKGWVFVSREGIDASPKSLLSETFGPEEYHAPGGLDHAGNFLDCVASRRDCLTPAETAHRSITLAHIGNISMLLGRKLRWDPVKEDFVGDSQASAMLERPMRGPWSL